ncbi:hypothetical protein AB0G67_13220 [Streptomyces sp. NPDC021056]|uniref:hypothetical protein n=1 Tax=Streptomyces sp. NPDC021056 TaxID=3155012 RepID=UPI0033FA5247
MRAFVLTGPQAFPVLMGFGGVTDEGRAVGWRAEQRARAKKGRLLVAVPMLVATAPVRSSRV